MPDEKQKRLVARKICVRDVVNSKYISEEGWNPSYVVDDKDLQISRLNLIAVVVDKAKGEGYSSLIVDDGTGKISLRNFEENGLLDRVNVGEVVLVIGRPREYGTERYILPEIIKKIECVDWFKLRKMEVCDEKIPDKVVQEVKKTEDVKKESAEEVIEFIKNEDRGKGVEVREILKNGHNEKWINRLLENGEIFEISPGRVKLLE